MKISEVTAPLPVASIKEFFQDKDTFFLINYEESKLKGKVLLTYLSNLDIPADIKLPDDFDDETIFELLDAYMEIKTISSVDILKAMMAHIVLKYIGVPTHEVFESTLLTEDQVDRYIETRKETLERWKFFLDSTMVYLLYIHTDLNEELRLEDQVPHIDDAMYLGHNVVNLFSVPTFMELFQGASEVDQMAFFVPQFTQHMFKGETLYPYFVHENNLMVPLMVSMMSGKIPIDPTEVFDKEEEEQNDG